MSDTIYDDPAWFSESGPDDDVVISTRVRLARNLTGLAFPSRMTEQDRNELLVRMVPVVADVLARPHYRHLDINTTGLSQLRFLTERNLLAGDSQEQRPLLLCIRRDQKVSVAVNGADHIHIAGLRTGLRAQDVLADVRSLDEELDETLRFAVDMNFGFLTSEIASCGTGMRCGTLLHVPAISETGELQDVLSRVQAAGFRVKRFASSQDSSLGSVYQISDRGEFGKSEETVIRELEAVTGEIVQVERESRLKLVEQESSEFRTHIDEALRFMRMATALETEDALRTVLWLRVGAAVGLIPGSSTEQITPLLFEVQKSHILRGMEAGGGSTGTRGDSSGITDSMVAAHRADLVRRLL